MISKWTFFKDHFSLDSGLTAGPSLKRVAGDYTNV